MRTCRAYILCTAVVNDLTTSFKTISLPLGGPEYIEPSCEMHLWPLTKLLIFWGHIPSGLSCPVCLHAMNALKVMWSAFHNHEDRMILAGTIKMAVSTWSTYSISKQKQSGLNHLPENAAPEPDVRRTKSMQIEIVSITWKERASTGDGRLLWLLVKGSWIRSCLCPQGYVDLRHRHSSPFPFARHIYDLLLLLRLSSFEIWISGVANSKRVRIGWEKVYVYPLQYCACELCGVCLKVSFLFIRCVCSEKKNVINPDAKSAPCYLASLFIALYKKTSIMRIALYP